MFEQDKLMRTPLLPPAIYVWIVPSEDMLDQPGSWRIRKWDTEPFPEANFTLSGQRGSPADATLRLAQPRDIGKELIASLEEVRDRQQSETKATSETAGVPTVVTAALTLAKAALERWAELYGKWSSESAHAARLLPGNPLGRQPVRARDIGERALVVGHVGQEQPRLERRVEGVGMQLNLRIGGRLRGATGQLRGWEPLTSSARASRMYSTLSVMASL